MTAELLDDETLVEVVLPAASRRRRRRLLRRLRALWWVHNSGRFDKPSNLWRAAMTYCRRKGSVVTGTEAAGRPAALFREALADADWGYAHLAGAAEGEAYAAWDLDDIELVGRPFARKLTDKTWVRSPAYGGKRAAKVHALVVRLREIRTGRTWWVVVVHMPLDNTLQRAEAWVDCCRGLVDLERDLERRDPDAEVVIVGDFNKNLREPDERRAVQQRLCQPLDARVCWTAGDYPSGGTHGRQLIDYAIAAGFAGAQLLRDLPDSDHRAFRYRPRSRRSTR